MITTVRYWQVSGDHVLTEAQLEMQNCLLIGQDNCAPITLQVKLVSKVCISWTIFVFNISHIVWIYVLQIQTIDFHFSESRSNLFLFIANTDKVWPPYNKHSVYSIQGDDCSKSYCLGLPFGKKYIQELRTHLGKFLHKDRTQGVIALYRVRVELYSHFS